MTLMHARAIFDAGVLHRRLLAGLLVLMVSIDTAFIMVVAEDSGLSDDLLIAEIEDGVYVHSSDSNNGLVVISEGQALAVSTPADALLTDALIDWITVAQRAALIGFVADRWHPDAMGGLAAVHSRGVRSFAHTLTRQTAKNRGLPVAQIGFEDRIEIAVGRKTVVVEHMGKAHTADGVVAWVLQDRVLFAGNAVRSAGGWIGNVGDANLAAWSQTVSRVRARFPDAVHVIPGHGETGGPELLDYTIELYRRFSPPIDEGHIETTDVCDVNGRVVMQRASSDRQENGVRYLTDGVVLLRDAYKIVRVAFTELTINDPATGIVSPAGTVEIFDKLEGRCALRTHVTYDDMFAKVVNDSVGWAIVLKSAEPAAGS